MTRDNNPDRLDDGARAEAEMKEREAPASATESLLADAREALSYSAMGLRRIHDALVRPGPKQAVGEMVEHFMTKADATLSRLKPGEKGGGE